MKPKTIISILVLVSACGGLTYRAYLDSVPIDSLERLQNGMTKNEVKSLLGPPTEIYSDSQWAYKKFLVFGFVNIHWKEDGTYDGEYNYERY